MRVRFRASLRLGPGVEVKVRGSLWGLGLRLSLEQAYGCGKVKLGLRLTLRLGLWLGFGEVLSTGVRV